MRGARFPHPALAGTYSSILIGCALELLTARAGAADLALINGNVFTQSKAQRSANAVLIRDGKFAVVGANPEVIKAARPGTAVIDLHGWYVYPGFQDARTRLGECGPPGVEVRLDAAQDLPALRAALRDSLATLGKGAWLVGTGWDPQRVRGTRQALDSLSRPNPIFLRTADGHAAWLNTRALQALGIRLDAPDPPGGRYGRDAAGALDGLCWEMASLQAVERWVDLASTDQVAAAIERRIAAAAGYGVTTFHDASPARRSAEAFALLARKGRLKARVIESPMPQLPDGYAAWTEGRGVDPVRLALGPDLLVVDGTTRAGGAAVRGAGADSGNLLLAGAPLDSLLQVAFAAGRGVALETSGERAVSAALDALERFRRTAAATGADSARGPVRLERMERVDPRDLPRLRPAGACFVLMGADLAEWQAQQPALTPGDSAMLVHPVRSVVAAGAPLVLGSDATPERASPARMLQATLTDFRVQERLGPSMGPACLTTALARAAGEAESVGTIEVGRRADLVVLDRDLLRVPPDLVGSSRVLLTVAAGEVTHRSEL